MRGRFWGRHWRVTVLGAILCLLATVFAIEAKLAWFSPEGSAPAQISAAKLQPGDSAKMIVQALDSPSTATPEAPLLLAFTVLVLAIFLTRRPFPDHRSVETHPSFSPPVFFRPPPGF